MNFLISDTFTASLACLNGEEQKAVKTTAFDRQSNPANPGHHFHKLERARDKRFWSVRVGSDIRLIVHRADESLLLCYVDHHDKAYLRAEQRRLETHPQTGAVQIVEIRERVEEIRVPITGSAGTGKTIVALHRVNQILRQKEDVSVLLTTFSAPLANALTEKLYRLTLRSRRQQIGYKRKSQTAWKRGKSAFSCVRSVKSNAPPRTSFIMTCGGNPPSKIRRPAALTVSDKRKNTSPK